MPEDHLGVAGRHVQLTGREQCSSQVECVGGLCGRAGQIAVTCPGLERAGPKLSAHPAELLADAQQACVQADILPTQAEDLAAAHAVQQQQNERRKL
jgi:hypothetical protein